MLKLTPETISAQAIEQLVNQPQNYDFPRTQSEKYNRGVIAMHEMKLARDLLSDSQLEPIIALELIRQASEQGKPHIGVEILNLLRKRRSKPSISFDEVKKIVRDFVSEVSCNQFSYGTCWMACPHDVVPDEHYACSISRISIGYEVLRDYAPSKTRSKASLEALKTMSSF